MPYFSKSISAGAPPQTPLVSLQRSRRSPSWTGKGKRDGRGRKEERKGRGKGGKGMGNFFGPVIFSCVRPCITCFVLLKRVKVKNKQI